jgi:hypothetical protein
MRTFTPRCAALFLALCLATVHAHGQDSFTGKGRSVFGAHRRSVTQDSQLSINY